MDGVTDSTRTPAEPWSVVSVGGEGRPAAFAFELGIVEPGITSPLALAGVRTEPGGVASLERIERSATAIADVMGGLPVLPSSPAMLDVPGSALVAPVPLGGLLASQPRWRMGLAAFDRSGPVNFLVIRFCEAGKVAEIVVRRVEVDVVNVVTFGDGSVGCDPQFFVVPPNASLAVSLARSEVEPVRPAW